MSGTKEKLVEPFARPAGPTPGPARPLEAAERRKEPAACGAQEVKVDLRSTRRAGGPRHGMIQGLSVWPPAVKRLACFKQAP